MEGKINGPLCCTRLFACSLSINGNLEGWALCRSINFQICFVNQCFYFYFLTFDGVLKNAFKMDFIQDRILKAFQVCQQQYFQGTTLNM